MKTFFLYIDPGSGSYLVQVIIAAVLGFLFYFKNIWFRIKAFFRKDKSTEPVEPEDTDKTPQ